MSERYEINDLGHRILIYCQDGSLKCFDPSTCGGTHLEDVAVGVIRQLRADIAERDARIAAFDYRERAERAEAELARLRAQEPVGAIESSPFGLMPAMVPFSESRLRAGAKLYAEPMPAPSLKDNEIAQLVNQLRDCAVEFHAAQQLRERIAAIVAPALRGVRSPMPAKVAK